MKTRAGVTLLETLVAIFIMGIGMLAILTLFPLGALSMANALRDQRLSEAAQQADGIANARDLRNDPSRAYQNAFTRNGTLLMTWDGPSYPVFVDPWGMRSGAPATIGGVISRTDVSFTDPNPPFSVANAPQATMRWFGLQDEMTFGPNGAPPARPLFEPKITWAYWMKRPNSKVTNVVDMHIVVYHSRNLQLPALETPLANMDFPTNTGINPAAVSLDASGTRPDIRRGMWILDVTQVPLGNAEARTYGPVHGTWHRVIDAVDAGTVVVLELQPKPTTPVQSLIIMEGVAEVFPSGTGWK